MKPILIVVLGGSLVLNVWLLSLVTSRARAPEPARAAGTAPAARTPGEAGSAPAKGAPLSPEAARHLKVGQAISNLHAALARIVPSPPPDPRYWHNASYLRNPYTPEQRAERAAAQREFAAAIQQLTGEKIDGAATLDPRRGVLSPEKLDALLGIEADYANAVAAVNEKAAGLRLPSDEARIKSLAEARDSRLAALLTPEERLAVDLRTPGVAGMGGIVGQIAPSIETEEDYRKVFELQKAFDSRYPDASSSTRGVGILEAGRIRREAEPGLIAEIRAALGEEKYAALVHANDADRRNAQLAERRLSLPEGTAEKAIELRTQYALESQKLLADQSLTPAARIAQTRALAVRAEADLRNLFGPAGATGLIARTPWVRYLDQGAAIAASVQDVPPEMKFLELSFNSFPLSPLQDIPVAPRGRGGP